MAEPRIELAVDAIEVSPGHTLRVSTVLDPGPFAREALRCPVFPGIAPREKQDQVLLEDSQNPSKKLFLPQYRLYTYSDENGVRRQQIHLRCAAEYTIIADLEPFPAPELGDAGRTAAQATGMAVRSLLQLQLWRGDKLLKQFDFQRLEDNSGRLRATLTISSDGDQVALDTMMKDGTVRFVLALTRRLDLASMENPGEVKRCQDSLRVYSLSIAFFEGRLAQRSRTKFGPKPVYIIDPGDSDDALRWEIKRLEGLRYAVYAALARANRWLVATVTLPATQPLEVRVADLEFNRPAWQGLRMQTTKGGQVYFQKVSQLNQFYYLPEYFDLVGEKGSPRFLKIRAARGFRRFQVEYQAFPRVNKQGRLLKDARTELLEMAGPGFSNVELWPLKPDAIGNTKMTYTLRLPHEDDLHWSEESRPSASCQDLHHRITDSFEVGLVALKRLRDAMFGGSRTLFTGKIEVKMGDWVQTVGFQGRVEGDRDALWNRIYEEPGADISQSISVEVPADAFAGDIIAVRVKFTPGNEVTLTRNKLTGTGRVDMEINDFLMDRVVSADYSYLLHVDRQSGTTTSGHSSKEDALHITREDIQVG
jgi:hypothetical protein